MSDIKRNEFEDYESCIKKFHYCGYDGITGKFTPITEELSGVNDGISRGGSVRTTIPRARKPKSPVNEIESITRQTMSNIIKDTKSTQEGILDLFLKGLDEVERKNEKNRNLPNPKDELSLYLFEKTYNKLPYLLQAQVSILNPMYISIPNVTANFIWKTLNISLEFIYILPAIVILGYLDHIINPIIAGVIVSIYIIYIFRLRE